MSVANNEQPGVRCLPIATLPTGRYFVDLRLGEFRQVEIPFSVVRFGSDAGQDMCRRANVVSCPSCGTHVIAPGTTRQGEFYCVRCLHRID
jgi:hypothetical protein